MQDDKQIDTLKEQKELGKITVLWGWRYNDSQSKIFKGLLEFGGLDSIDPCLISGFLGDREPEVKIKF